MTLGEKIDAILANGNIAVIRLRKDSDGMVHIAIDSQEQLREKPDDDLASLQGALQEWLVNTPGSSSSSSL